MNLSRKDVSYSVITGLTTGFIAWRILAYLKTPTILGWPALWLVIVLPLLWIAGVWLGYFLGRWIGIFTKFGKFAAVGFTNAAVDFGVLNLLIASSGIAAGFWFSVFKAISFVAANFHSYLWNKYWVFEAGGSINQNEMGRFFGVALIGLLVNVGAASAVVNLLDPIGGLSAEAWANVGAITGSAAALLFSFFGYRALVFKKN